eukprot:COSAG05_NODE_1543_length_4591_cov_1.921416_6_plen_378_part_00
MRTRGQKRKATAELPGQEAPSNTEGEEYEVADILERRTASEGAGGAGRVEYKVQWKGFPDPADCTWEPTSSLLGAQELIAAYETNREQGIRTDGGREGEEGEGEDPYDSDATERLSDEEAEQLQQQQRSRRQPPPPATSSDDDCVVVDVVTASQRAAAARGQAIDLDDESSQEGWGMGEEEACDSSEGPREEDDDKEASWQHRMAKDSDIVITKVVTRSEREAAARQQAINLDTDAEEGATGNNNAAARAAALAAPASWPDTRKPRRAKSKPNGGREASSRTRSAAADSNTAHLPVQGLLALNSGSSGSSSTSSSSQQQVLVTKAKAYLLRLEAKLQPREYHPPGRAQESHPDFVCVCTAATGVDDWDWPYILARRH